MATLIIHAPKAKAEINDGMSIHEMMDKGVCKGYAIPKKYADCLKAGDKVVLLSKDEQLRAEGKLVRITPKGTTKTGMVRYDIHVMNMKFVRFKTEKFWNTGVRVDCR